MSKLTNLFKGAPKQKALIENKSLKLLENAAGDAVLYVYDEIGFYGIEAQDFANALSSLNGQPITVRIASNGGSVSEGLAIYSMLRDYSGTVTTVNDSVAASIASVIYMAGDIRNATAFSSFMTHKPMAAFYGNSDELEAHAQLLAHFNEVLTQAYIAGGISEENAASLINSGDKWFMLDEALEIGFTTAESEAPAMAAAVNLDIFDKVPQKVTNTLQKVTSFDNVSLEHEINEPINEVENMPDEKQLSDSDLAEARSQGFKDANARYLEVMALDSVKGREELAQTLLASDMTAEQIDNALKVAPIANANGLTVEALTDTAEGLTDTAEVENEEVDKVANFAANIGKKIK